MTGNRDRMSQDETQHDPQAALRRRVTNSSRKNYVTLASSRRCESMKLADRRKVCWLGALDEPTIRGLILYRLSSIHLRSEQKSTRVAQRHATGGISVDERGFPLHRPPWRALVSSSMPAMNAGTRRKKPKEWIQYGSEDKPTGTRREVGNDLQNWSKRLYVAACVLACLGVSYGVFLDLTQLKSLVECDMTWSQRVFIHVPMVEHERYRLFKFTDRRDPLHRRLIDHGPRDAADFCTGRPIVVYIPGHGGSYEQSRSIGAHGLQLSRRNIAILTGHQARLRSWNGTMPTLDDFFYDVFAFDLQEEFTGLHGLYLLVRCGFR